MDIIIGRGVDINSIDKCLMDHYATITDHATNATYIVFEKEYFSFTVSESICNIKCDYECRNYIMKQLLLNAPERYYKGMMMYNFDGKLVRKNNIFYNKRRPYMIFTNEHLNDYENTITETYQNVDVHHMKQMVNHKKCHQDFFVVYLGDGEFMSCNTHSFHVNYYNKKLADVVAEKLYSNPYSELVKRDRPVINPKTYLSEDVNGNRIEQNKYYYLRLFNGDNDVLDVFNDTIVGSTEKDNLIVECVHGDHNTFILHQKKYLCVYNNEIKLTPNPPPQDQSLMFTDTDGHKFKIVHNHKYMDIEWVKASTGVIVFNHSGVDLGLEPF